MLTRHQHTQRLWRSVFLGFQARIAALTLTRGDSGSKVGITTRNSQVPARHISRQESKGFSSHSSNWRDRLKVNMASSDMADEIADRFEGTSIAGGGGGRHGGSKSRGGRSGGGGGGGGRAKGRDVDLSRALSKLLRHQAASAGIQLDNEGYAPLDKVLQWGPIRSLKPTFDEILTAVKESDKQRFALKPNPSTNPGLDESSTDPYHWLIRANQGHSIKLESESLLKPIALPTATSPESPEAAAAIPEGSVPVPSTVVHGTYFAFWPSIVESGGLKPMGRNHVHCSIGLPEDEQGVISGMRKDAELLVYVDVERSITEAGMKWWMSENGVVLTEGDENGLVPLRFFREVVGRKQDVGLLWKDGEWVADLPGHLKIRMPMGKGPGRGGGKGRGGRGGGRGRGH